MDAYLQAYGDRAVEELKLEKPSLRDQPAILVGIIRKYCRLALSAETMEAANREIRTKAEAAMHECLKGHPLRMSVFQFVLHNARRAIANRENMRFERSRLYGIVRRMFQRLGQLFAKKGVLDRDSDIFYLTLAEVFGFVEGTAVTLDLKSLVALRRKEYARFEELHLQDRILTTGIPYLSPVEELGTSGVEGNLCREPAALPESLRGWPGLSSRPQLLQPGANISSWPRHRPGLGLPHDRLQRNSSRKRKPFVSYGHHRPGTRHPDHRGGQGRDPAYSGRGTSHHRREDRGRSVAIVSFDFDLSLRETFLDFGYEIYRGDRSWIAPLRGDLCRQLTPEFPFYAKPGNCCRHFLATAGEKERVGFPPW